VLYWTPSHFKHHRNTAGGFTLAADTQQVLHRDELLARLIFGGTVLHLPGVDASPPATIHHRHPALA
jgi:hypothetical protein